MLAAVLLHEGEAPGPVDLAGDGRAGLQRRRAGVHHLVAPLLHVQHPDPVQVPQVRGLTAALGEKGRAVQHDGEALFYRFAGKDRRGEAAEVGVFIVQSPGSHVHSSQMICVHFITFFHR